MEEELYSIFTYIEQKLNSSKIFFFYDNSRVYITRNSCDTTFDIIPIQEFYKRYSLIINQNSIYKAKMLSIILGQK